MLHIAGGTYREICREPTWDELYGSGLRAAAVVASLEHSATLHTYISNAHRDALDAYSENFGLAVGLSSTPQTIVFSYSHGLARPFIDPPKHLLTTLPALVVDADAVLRFGMLDGDAVVHGQRVVYDPQASHRPVDFSANGSMAAHLAIVANQREAASLTGETEPDDMGRSLLRVNRADVAVIKMGAHGARVISHGSAESIPAHRTKSIFPIGSGDVFSAVFAFHWAEKGRGAVEAATVASAATAQYCSNPHAFLNRLPVGSLGAPIQPTGGGRQPRRVYLAGPFFTAAQRWLVYEARTALASQGVEVFSPLHDVGEGPASEVAVKDLAGLKTSDAVLAIVDEFDAGTLFEVGYARSRDIPVVALVQNAPPGPLKMIEGSGCEIVDDFVSSIYRTVWAALER